MSVKPKILVYGYGNPGREDDALGILIADEIDKWVNEEGLDNIGIDSNYQLNIEDAAEIADKDIVIFADASKEDINGFSFSKVNPSSAKVEFTMHAVSPAFVLDLCRKIYNKIPDTYLLHIKGYEWSMKESISEGAKENLGKALEFLKKLLKNPGNIPDKHEF